MSDEEFRDLVKRMRTCQRMYFQTRSPGVLEEAKRLEKEVDREIDVEQRDGLRQRGLPF